MKVLIAGDTHGDLEQIRYLLDVCKENDIDTIFQLGDFGFIWADNTLKPLEQMLSEAKVNMFFIDGNHENFDRLEAFKAFGHKGLKLIGLDLVYIPRGVVFEFYGVNFLGLGGAVSIDQESRIQGVSWWPQETITYKDVETALKNNDILKSQGKQVDVMLTHDAPNNPKLDEHLANFSLSTRLASLSAASRHAVTEVYNQVGPKILFHGHYHLRYVDMVTHDKGVGTVRGLDCNGTREASWYILNLDEFKRVREG